MEVPFHTIFHRVIIIYLKNFNGTLIHKMILKEEKYLEALHGEKYLAYKKNVPRYLLI